jgi:D-alanyl-D-alanine carboxypeptidase (penicillin-binding protein 5/6)
VYSIVATATRGNLRLIAVVAGAASSEERYETAFEMLEWGFATFGKLDVVREGERLNVSVGVENGTAARINPVAGASLSLIHRREDTARIALRYQVRSSIAAPLTHGQAVGEVIVEKDGKVIGVVPAVVPADVAAVGLLATAR